MPASPVISPPNPKVPAGNTANWSDTESEYFFLRVANLLGITTYAPTAATILTAWKHFENGSGSFNPLGVGGTRSFSSAEEGAQATANAIRNYPGIVAALKARNALLIPETDINKWVTGNPLTPPSETGYNPAGIQAQLKKIPPVPVQRGPNGTFAPGLPNPIYPPAGVATPIAPGVPGVGSVLDFLSKLSAIFSSAFWIRVGLIMGGLLIGAFGLYIVAKGAGAPRVEVNDQHV